MPGKTYITDNQLCCKHNNKTHVLKIYANMPIRFRHDLHVFLHDTLEIRTSDEIREMIEHLDGSTEAISQIDSWTAIKKKSIKEIIIDQFVIDMQKKYQLGIRTARDLLADIYVYILFKFIQPVDIKIAGGRIQEISCLSFDQNKYHIKGAYSTDVHIE